jgi:hypothetical protein
LVSLEAYGGSDGEGAGSTRKTFITGTNLSGDAPDITILEDSRPMSVFFLDEHHE